jgi:hypothetical protein
MHVRGGIEGEHGSLDVQEIKDPQIKEENSMGYHIPFLSMTSIRIRGNGNVMNWEVCPRRKGD